MVAAIKHMRYSITELSKLAYYTSIGGNKNKYFAKLSEYLVQHKINASALYVDPDSQAINMLTLYQMYINMPIYHQALNNKKAITNILDNLPILLISDKTKLHYFITDQESKHLQITRLHYFAEANESLFLMSKSKKFITNIKLPKYVTFPQYGFLQKDKINNQSFSWVKNNALLGIYAPKGIYTITLAIIPNSYNQHKTTNKLFIYYNKTLIHQDDFINSSMENPGKIKFKINLQNANSTNKIRINTTAKADNRGIVYGVIYPIELKKVTSY
jgi:hypothetical protein